MYKTINSDESALKALNLPTTEEITITGVPEEFVPALKAVYSALLRSKAIREGWKPDYQENTRKWESWYYLRKDDSNPSGFRFYVSGYTITHANSVLGSLLSQETEEKSTFLAKQLEEMFNPDSLEKK